MFIFTIHVYISSYFVYIIFSWSIFIVSVALLLCCFSEFQYAVFFEILVLKRFPNDS